MDFGSGPKSNAPLEPDYSGIIRFHARATKQRRRQLGVAAVILAILFGAGYWGYHRFFRFSHLLEGLDLCPVGSKRDDPGLDGDCKAAVEALAGYSPHRCPIFVKAIVEQENVNQRNLVLHALLKGAGGDLGRGFPPRPCIEDAVLQVHKRTCKEVKCRPMGHFVARPEIWGVASYNQALTPWAAHLRLLDRLEPRSFNASLPKLGDGLERLLSGDDPRVRETALTLSVRHLVPALSRTYEALTRGELSFEHSLGARDDLLVPGNLAMMLATLVAPDHPLAKRILDHLFKTVLPAAQASPRSLFFHIDFLNRAMSEAVDETEPAGAMATYVKVSAGWSPVDASPASAWGSGWRAVVCRMPRGSRTWRSMYAS